MALIWTKHLSVENATLDKEHQNLIGMVNLIEYAIAKKDRDALLRGVRSFKRDADAHFESESRFARALGFDFVQHELSHQHIRRALLQTIGELESMTGPWHECAMDRYPQWLRDWLINHISIEDMQMKPALQKHAYGFKAI